MRLALALLILAACSVGTAQAQAISYNISYSISPALGTSETLEIGFAEPVEANVSTFLSLGDISGLSMQADGIPMAFEERSDEAESVVYFSIPAGTKGLEAEFAANGLVLQGEGYSQFFAAFRPPAASKNVSISVTLPEGYSVYRDAIFPESPAKSTDGKRITLSWSMQRQPEIAISVRFHSNGSQDYAFPAIAPVAALAIFLIYRLRMSSRERFLSAFSEDEKKVILLLMKERSVYQKSVEKEFSFSRARTTRMMKRLESRGLIKRQAIGRKNRVIWSG